MAEPSHSPQNGRFVANIPIFLVEGASKSTQIAFFHVVYKVQLVRGDH